MNTKIIAGLVGLVLVLVGALGQKTLFGAAIQQLDTFFTTGIYIGETSGQPNTLIADAIHGTCNASFSGTSLAASSSGQFFCAVTGARSGDRVFVSLPAGAAANAQGAGSVWGGFTLSGSYATTTDVIGFNISNLTGAATTSFRQATTSVQYWIVR